MVLMLMVNYQKERSTLIPLMLMPKSNLLMLMFRLEVISNYQRERSMVLTLISMEVLDSVSKEDVDQNPRHQVLIQILTMKTKRRRKRRKIRRARKEEDLALVYQTFIWEEVEKAVPR